MEPTWKTPDGSIRLFKGDCREVLKSFPAETFTACVTDPPYHLTSGNAVYDYSQHKHKRKAAGGGFMGKAWDGGDVAMRPETWAEVLRVLKPGAHLLAFGGTRTYHRICCAIEDAGFEIRDCIMWIYGSGFPKSLDVSKAIDKAAGAEREIVGSRPYTCDDAAKLWSGYGTALKPAYEPIIVARKPLNGTVAANCQEHGCGALNIDECRVQAGEALVRPSVQRTDNEVYGKGLGAGTQVEPQGRWPANLIHDGSDEVLAGFPSLAGGGFGKRGGARQSEYGLGGTMETVGFGDSGSAARFFYCAKASKSDRGEGNTHPTVKPLKLMEYLVKLVTMPGENRILDPFAGSGTTLIACDNQFIPCIGIDLELDHLEIMERRAKNEVEKTPLLNKVDSLPTQREFL